MLEDLSRALEEVRVRRNNVLVRDGYASKGTFSDPLEWASRNNKSADTDFVKECLAHLRNKLSGKINKKQFMEGMGVLEQAALQYKKR